MKKGQKVNLAPLSGVENQWEAKKVLSGSFFVLRGLLISRLFYNFANDSRWTFWSIALDSVPEIFTLPVCVEYALVAPSPAHRGCNIVINRYIKH